MTIQIIFITGFLGAGKTTFINKVLPFLVKEHRVAIIENDFGEISFDRDFLSDKGAYIKDLRAGCICCSLQGEMKTALQRLIIQENPDIIFVEPSGISRSTELIACLNTFKLNGKALIRHVVHLIDASTFTDYIEGLGDFYEDQIKNASVIFLSHQDSLDTEQKNCLMNAIHLLNSKALIIPSDWLNSTTEKIWDLIQSEYAHQRVSHHDRYFIAEKIKKGHDFSTWRGHIKKNYTQQDIENIFQHIDLDKGGLIFRAKGYLPAEFNQVWMVNYLKGHIQIQRFAKNVVTDIVIIGKNLNTDQLNQWFQ